MNVHRLLLRLCVLLWASGFTPDTAATFGVPDGTTRSTQEIRDLIEAAEPGDIIRIDPGHYVGPLEIRKPVVLEGGGAVTVDGDGAGTVVRVMVGGVTVRGFTIRGSGKVVEQEPAGLLAEEGPVVVEDNVFTDVLFGVDLRTAPDSVIRGNHITGKDLRPGRRGDGIRIWWCNGTTIEENTLRGVRDAVFWYSEGCTIRRNRVSDGRYGLHFMYSHRSTVSENDLEGNSVGVYLMYCNEIVVRDNRLVRNRGSSGYGIGLKDCDDLYCESNRIFANRIGIYADRTPFSTNGVGSFRENRIAYNDIGMALTPQTTNNRIYDNAFIENEEQVSVTGRGTLSGNAFAHQGRGNFWSDYAGFDRDGDGIGDVPYVSVSLFATLISREPLLRFFAQGPGQQAIEFTARAMPQVRPEPKFTDPAPLAIAPATAIDRAPFRWPMFTAGLALLLVGGSVIGAGRTPRRTEKS